MGMNGYTDPVCHLNCDEHSAVKTVQNGHVYYFCSTGCRSAFEKEPQRYADQSGRYGWDDPLPEWGD